MESNQQNQGQNVGSAPPRLPREGKCGYWECKSNAGNCMWIFELDAVPPVYNPQGLTWRQILQNLGFADVQGVMFSNGCPDFTPFLQQMTYPGYHNYGGTYTFTTNNPMTDKRATNMAYGYREIANHFDARLTDVRKSMSQLRITWHETEDQNSMQLIPTIIHGNIPHVGGVSAVKHGGIGAAFGKNSFFEDFTYEQQILSGDLQEITVTYYTETKGKVAQEQYDAWSRFQAIYPKLREKINEAADDYINRYAEISAPEATNVPKGADLAITDVIVYPENENQPVQIGVLMEFSLDEGHGIGFLVGGEMTDTILDYGPDFVAL